MQKYIFQSIFLASILFLTSCHPNKKQPPAIINGIADLSSWDFKQDGNIPLNGKWEFYWHQYINPDKFTSSNIKPTLYATVPGYWMSGTDSSAQISGSGYATYHLKVKMPKKNTKYGIKSRAQGTTYAAYVNGILIGSAGKLGKTLETNKPGLTPFQTVVFSDENAELDIVFHCSNFDHRGGGLWEPVTIGLPDSIEKETANNVALIFTIAGILLIMCFYHFVLYFLHKTQTSTLAFAILLLSMLFRQMMTDDIYLLFVFPNIDFHFYFKFLYVTAFLNIILIPWFLYELFKQDFPKLSFKIILVGGILVNGFIIIAPLPLFSNNILLLNGILLISVLYLLLYVQPKAIIHKREGAWIALAGTIGFYGAGVHDMLKALQIIHAPNFIAHYGLAFYVISQSVLIARRFSIAFKQNKKLTVTLDYQNKNLENIVKERTSEITLQKEELKVQAENLIETNQMVSEKNEELQQQNEEINAQKEEIEIQKELLDRHHESLQSSIRYAETIQRAMLPSQEKMNEYFMSELIFMPKNIVSGDFYWLSDPKNENTKNQTVFAAVVDCTGHGVPGAFMSMIGNRILNNLVNQQKLKSPAEILTKLNKAVRRALNQEKGKNTDGMDLILCKFEKQQSEETKITFCGAKQSVYHVPKGGVNPVRYKGDRKSVGGNKSIRTFTDKEFIAKQGDRIFMMSDGFADQNAPDRSKIGTLKVALEFSTSAHLTLKEQKESLLKLFEAHRLEQPLRDDITLWAIELK